MSQLLYQHLLAAVKKGNFNIVFATRNNVVKGIPYTQLSSMLYYIKLIDKTAITIPFSK